ncbi:MAG: B12-binding domain-containing radical SAM protein [Desulfobacterales bacterium]|nr:B12-binding domain-containing radical SAM protein [Desulfobacterales bacterium]
MNISKIVLVQPPIQDFYLTKKRTIPYGLASIAASLIDNGFDVEILDCLASHKSKKIKLPGEFSFLKPFYGKNDMSAFSLFHAFRHFGYSYEYAGTKIREKEPFIVGISSLFTAYSNQSIKTAIIVKKFYPKCKIVLGGHHPTLFPEKVLECDAIDFVLQGEAETSMTDLCKALKNNTDLKQVPGIAFREKDACFVADPAWIKDLSAIPIPENQLINHGFYQRKNQASTTIVSSRGCPMQCSYCSVSASSAHASFRQRSVENIFDEIKIQTRDVDVGFIDFEDENLCLNKKWFIKLFSKIKFHFKDKKVELRAMNGLYPPAIDEEIVSLMTDCGFKTLNLSLGSASKTQLAKFNRPDVRKAFENALDLSQKYGLETVSYIIAAAPGQTAESSLKDLLYLAQKRTLAGLSIFYPAPGSLDYELCKNNKILPDNFSLMRSSALPLDDTTTRIEAATLLRLSRILNFMKHLMDSERTIPESRPFYSLKNPETINREPLSKILLQWFLHDGKIRGVHPNGEIYIHLSDINLTQTFINQIKNIHIKGVKPQINLV